MWELFLLSVLVGFVTGVGAYLTMLLHHQHSIGGDHAAHA